MVKGLEGPEFYSLLEPGEFVSIASQVYKNPGWLTNNSAFFESWLKNDYENAGKYFEGKSIRANLEADAFLEGAINVANANLGTHQSSAVVKPASTASAAGGHWEDRTVYDPLTGIAIGGDNKVWVQDTAPVRPASASSATASTGNPGVSRPAAARLTDPDKSITHGSDGSLTITVRVDKPQSAGSRLRTGDVVTTVFGPDGERQYESITRIGADKLNWTIEKARDPETGEWLEGLSIWDGDTQVERYLRDSSGELVGNTFIESGIHYTRSIDDSQTTRWLDPHGGSWDERIAQGIAASDAKFSRHESSVEQSEDPSKGQAPSPQLDEGRPGDQAPSPQLEDELVALIQDALDPLSHPGGGSGWVVADSGGVMTDAGLVNGYGSGAFGGAPSDAQSSFRQSEINEQNTQAAAAALDARDAARASAALGLINTLAGLRNWDQQDDVSHASTVVALYGQLNFLSDGRLGAASGLGSLGSLGAGLGLLSALESGNAGGILVNGIGLADAMGQGASQAIADMLQLGEGAVDGIVPGIGLLMALDSGDPVSIAASSLSLISSMGVAWAGPAAAALVLISSFFTGQDQPMVEGGAQAVWDEDGHVQVLTTHDTGGGASATGWMNQIAGCLQAQVAGMVDSEGGPLYGLIAPRLPVIGYQYDPDGMNYAGARGHLYLQWVDEQGQAQTRYYDGAGERSDGTGQTLAGDFMQLAASAIVPAWEAATILDHWQETRLSQGLDAANAEARQLPASGMPQEAADHLTQTFHALTVETAADGDGAPAARSAALVDIDGDGYLELTQWFKASQGILAIDLNSDGGIITAEFLNAGDGAPATARNNAAWLDINHDGRLDARDPAFLALRIWMDVNGDGRSQADELQGLARAGISALDFSRNPPQLVRTDGSTTALTAASLSGDVLGTALQDVEGGLLQYTEGGETVLHALNLRAFDGQAAHVHGGQASMGGSSLVDAGDVRLRSSTFNTVAGSSVQGTAAPAATLLSGAGGKVLAGQPQGSMPPETITPGSAQVRSSLPATPLAFVSAGAGSAAQAVREVLQSAVRHSEGVLSGPGGAFLAVAAAAGAAQWAGEASAGTEVVGSISSEAAPPGLLPAQHPGSYTVHAPGDPAPALANDSPLADSPAYLPAYLPAYNPIHQDSLATVTPAHAGPPQQHTRCR